PNPRRGRPDAAELQPAAGPVPPAPAALARPPILVGAARRRVAASVRHQLLLAPRRRAEAAGQSREREHARVDGAVASAPPELGREASHRLPRALRVQLARVPGGLPAPDAAGACARGVWQALSAERRGGWRGAWRS